MSNRFAASVLAVGVLLSPTTFAAPPAGGGTRLDYRTEQALKDAAYYVTQTEGLVAAMEKESADWKPGDATVSIQAIRTVLNTRDKCNQYLKSAEGRIAGFPAAHPRVAPELKRIEAIKARLAAVEAKAVAAEKVVVGVVAQGDAPEYKAAFDRLREINQMYANPSAFLNDLTAEDAEAARQLPAAKAERQRIAAKYDALLKQPTQQAKEMGGVLAYSDKVFAAYDKALADYLAAAPAAVEKQADEAVAVAKEGVEQKKPGYFGEHGGVESRLKRAEENAKVLAVVAPDAETTKRAAEKVKAARAQTAEMAEAFTASLVASNKLPNDNFTGPERDALLKVIADKWAKDGNGGVVLKTGVIGPQWQRQVKWTWRDAASAWEKSDKSRVQGWVVVKASEAEAVVWPVNFVKDHLANDAVTAYFLFDPKAPPAVISRMLLANVK